jgi:uncharacterized protein (TIGR02118 family)
MITRVGMAPRLAGTSFVEFQKHWRDNHGSIALGIPGLRGYVQNHAILDNGRPLLPYTGFDACSEIAFDDLAAMDAGFASPTYQTEVRADEDVMIDKANFFMLLCDRVVIDAHADVSVSVKLLTFMRSHPLASRDELLDIARGPYADLVQFAGAIRHEQLVPSLEAHAGRQPPNCELVDLVWFRNTSQAVDFVNGTIGNEADMVLRGKVFGRERLLASVRVVRELPAEDDQGVLT